MAVGEKTDREPVRIEPSGLVCPKDPKRNEQSVDGKGGPTHLQADVVRIETPNEKKPYLKRATLRCLTCEHQWTIDWPPKTA